MEGNVLQILDHLGTQGGALSTWAQVFYMSNGHNLPTSADSCLRCYVKAPIQSGVSHRLSRAVPLSSLLHYIGTTYLSRLPSSLKSGGNVWPLFPWRKLCELQRQWLDSPSPLSPASAEWAVQKGRAVPGANAALEHGPFFHGHPPGLIPVLRDSQALKKQDPSLVPSSSVSWDSFRGPWTDRPSWAEERSLLGRSLGLPYLH